MNKTEPKSQTLEALEKIRQAEDQARKIVGDAREGTSLKIIQEAQDEARSIKEKTLKEARERAKRMREEMIEKAEGEAERIREQTLQKIQTLNLKGEASEADAVKTVSEEMKKHLKGGVL